MAYTSDESGQPQVYVRPFPEVDAGRWQVSTSWRLTCDAGWIWKSVRTKTGNSHLPDALCRLEAFPTKAQKTRSGEGLGKPDVVMACIPFE